MTNVLVTGATGFIGSAVTRRFLEEGHDVRVLVRESSDRRNIENLPVEERVGDLRDRSSLKRAVSGCDVLVHTAADYRLWVPDPDTMYDINVKGTRKAIETAQEAGVDRIVYTSSVATLGINEEGEPADETTPASEEDMIGHYKRSKYRAEEAVMEMVSEQDAPVVLVHPSAPVGPRDIKPTPTGRMIMDTVEGNMPAYVDTGLNIVHVDDVADGHLLALNHGEVGKRYILGGDNLWLSEILTKTAELADQPPPTISIPQSLLYPFAYVSEAWATLTGTTPRLTRSALKMAAHRMFFRSERAKRELGYEPRSAEDALQDAVDWFREHPDV